ncbi:MAG: tetratricopeptide repeat protein [Litorilinea sp.]
MAQLKLALLGAPTVTLGEQSVVVESRKALALLFYLTITNQRQSRDWLAALFWPEQDQSRARASLRQVLWLLRSAGLQPWLVVDQDALELRGDYGCDVHHFQAALRANQIDEALALYRADLLTGFSLRDCPEFDQWHFLQADELRRQLADALKQWVLRCCEDGEYEQGLKYARRWLGLDPLYEPAHRDLMRLYAYAGQYSAALRQYKECVRLLEDELGVPPEDETTELYLAIKSRQIVPLVKARPELTAVGQTDPVIPGTAPPPPYHNLPLHLTTFVGRKAEIDELAKRVADPECRLVSIIGPGGIGKTRIAVHVAQYFVDAATKGPMSTSSLSDLFPQGVLFVALNTVDSTDGIIAAIAEAGGIGFYNNQAKRQQLLETLHERKMLLLLDNFEHLLAHADFVIDLLTHAPNITIMVTSRETLNLQGEWLWSLGGLDVPDDGVVEEDLLDYSAVHMFVQRARRIQPHFSFSAEYPHVVQICRLLGGVPLAIELATAWLRVISCAQIAREIERNLDFLTTRLRDVPQRHRSIRAVFEHSWHLLTSSEQETLQQLSVFRGGFDYQAAAQVAEASWLDLVALKEKSLLNVNSSGRYTVHELLRQYSAEKLERIPAQKDATLNRFGAYFVNFLYQRESILFGSGQLQAAADIAIELDNIRATWQWALQQSRFEEIRRSASAFYFFCQLQSRFLEGAETLQRAQHCLESLQPSDQRDLTLAAIYCHLGWLYIRLGEFELAATVSQRSRDLNIGLDGPLQDSIGGDPSVPLALVHHIQGDSHRALELAEEALYMAEAQSDTHSLTFIHYALTATNLALGNFEKAHTHVEAASKSTRAVGNRWFLPYILNESGKVARAMGNYAKAKSLFLESYEIKHEFSDPEGIAVALNHLGEIAWLQADYDEAHRLYTNAFEIYDEINDQGGLAASSRGLGQVACARQDLHAAKTWFERALQIAIKIRYWPLIYTLLLDVGHLLMQINAQSLAIEALALVQTQPASDVETKARARRQLDHWQSQLTPEEFAAAVQLGSGGDVEMTLQRVLVKVSAAV